MSGLLHRPRIAYPERRSSMAEHELDTLLGGFAADTLTAEEQQRLYAAALNDQRLFDALADEQGLKELLADPEVRRRLLEALRQPATSGIKPSMPWLNWLRTPSGLAWAGGLAAILSALTFGIPIYQESLDRQTRSVVTEEPASPAPVNPSPSRALPPPQPAAESTSSTKEKSPLPKMTQEAKRETPAKRQRADAAKQAPAENMRTAAEQPRLSEDRARLADAPSPAAPAAAPVPRPAPSALSATAAPVRSARALYYGEGAPSAGAAVKAEEHARGAGSPTVLGVRYSFALRGSDGQNQEVSRAIAARSREPVRLLVETTQDGYLQLLQNLGSAGTRLWWPPQETGKISLKAVARTRTDIPLPPPAESGLLDLVLRFSPKPFGPLTMQEVGMLDRFSGNLLVETISPGDATGQQESATYVVNPEASPAAQIAVEIPVSR